VKNPPAYLMGVLRKHQAGGSAGSPAISARTHAMCNEHLPPLKRTHRLSCDLCMRLCDACVAAYLLTCTMRMCIVLCTHVRSCACVRARWFVARRLVHCAVRGGVAAAATPPAASFDWNAHAYAPQPFNPYAYHYGPSRHAFRPPSAVAPRPSPAPADAPRRTDASSRAQPDP
jgi:hypothetical protein